MHTALLAVVFLAIYYGVTIYLCRGVKLGTRDMAMCAMMIALTMILESIRFPLPTGITIPFFSLVPLMVLALVVDYRLVFISGWVCGILSVFLLPAWQPVHWAQIFVEHMVCFSCLGYVGVFGVEPRWRVLCGMILASVLRLTGHIISGVIFFSQNAWSGWGAWGYSITYNASQNVPLCLLCILVVLALPMARIRKAVRKDTVR